VYFSQLTLVLASLKPWTRTSIQPDERFRI